MIRAILDTNVVLASLLSRRGASFEIMQRLRRNEWQMVLSNHLLFEYEEVLKRNAHLVHLSFPEVDQFLNALCLGANCVLLPERRPPRLADADDDPLLQLAEVSNVRLISTHNLRHLISARAYGVRVLLPRDFLRILRDRP